MTRLKTAWGIRRTRYLRLCSRSGDPKSTTPGSSANNLVIVSLLTLRNLAASATVKNCSSILPDCSFSTHCRDSRPGQSSSYYCIGRFQRNSARIRATQMLGRPELRGIGRLTSSNYLFRPHFAFCWISHQISESPAISGIRRGGHKTWQKR